MSYVKLSLLLIGIMIMTGATVYSQNQTVKFDSDRWTMRDAEVTEHMGRQCLQGFATLNDVEFENGIIEVDVFVDGRRSYPGIVFRMQSETDYERYYMRPHRMNLYPDAHQYTPVINGIAGWQIYNGQGFTSMGSVPDSQWVHLRMEVKGTQAQLFVDDAEQPALLVNHLQHGISKGTIGLQGPNDGTAYFSNFSYQLTDDLDFPAGPEVTKPLGIIENWEISPTIRASKIDAEKTYYDQGLTDLEWTSIKCESSGMIDLARYVGRSGPETDCIWARTIVVADKAERREYKFGYSDAICVFLNGELLFSGSSGYRQRDPSFLGIVGLHDAVYLPLKAGDNELLVMIAESFGGWGFIFQNGDYVYHHPDLTQKWDMPRQLSMPETVIYDKKRDILYVTNYFNNGNEFISKINLDGTIIEREWVTGLSRPTGMCLYNDKLYVVERTGLAEIDIEAGEIEQKFPVPGAVFLNDLAVDNNGNFYISDSRTNTIHKLTDGTSEIWLQHDAIRDPNCLAIDGDKLIVGNSGDGCLKAVSIDNKQISEIVCLGAGAIMDGVCLDGKGNYIISDFNGRVFLISKDGGKTELINGTVVQGYCANLEYIADKNMLIIPSLYENNLTAYRLKAF